MEKIDTNGLIDFNDRAALIIDGQFLVQGLRTFGEYAEIYMGVVLRKGLDLDELMLFLIDIVRSL